MKSFTFICLLCVVLAVKYSAGAFRCDETGYAEYLAVYPEKCGSECSPDDEYFKQGLKVYFNG